MPNINPLTGGGVPYPNFSNVVSRIIKISVALAKGKVYTSDSDGRLILPVASSGIVDLTNGTFQAMDDYPAPSAEDTDTGQVLTKPSYILMTDPTGGLTAGSEVELFSSGTTNVEADQVMPSAQPKTKGYLGMVYEIYTKNADGSIKEVSEADDLVVVQTGVA